jgi:hypothetical protein
MFFLQKFHDVMENARAKGRVSVRRSLFKLANNGNVPHCLLTGKDQAIMFAISSPELP